MKFIKNIFIVLIVCFNISILEATNKVYDDIIINKVISVYDGDTIRADIKGFPAIIGENIGIRLAGIDTPEMTSKNPELKRLAIEARDFLKGKIKNAKCIELKRVKRGKYFRIVGDLFLDNEDIAEALIKKGLAVKYNGGKKTYWQDFGKDKINKSKI